MLIGRWCRIFRFEEKVRNQQEYAEQELLQRDRWISEITDLIDWLNAASVKVRAAPAVDSNIDGKTVQLLISEHKVELSFCFNLPDFFGLVNKFVYSVYISMVLFYVLLYIYSRQYYLMMIYFWLVS